MTIAIKIYPDNFICCKTWTQYLDVKTSKKPKERVKNSFIPNLKKCKSLKYNHLTKIEIIKSQYTRYKNLNNLIKNTLTSNSMKSWGYIEWEDWTLLDGFHSWVREYQVSSLSLITPIAKQPHRNTIRPIN